jgi:hypothetical protein
LLVPTWSANPGVYAIVGMGAVVAGTTHGLLSAILIVYEMTNDYLIILPIMAAAGLSSVVARFIDPDSIYLGCAELVFLVRDWSLRIWVFLFHFVLSSGGTTWPVRTAMRIRRR